MWFLIYMIVEIILVVFTTVIGYPFLLNDEWTELGRGVVMMGIPATIGIVWWMKKNGKYPKKKPKPPKPPKQIIYNHYYYVVDGVQFKTDDANFDISSPPPAEWIRKERNKAKTLRPQILARDNYTCQKCGLSIYDEPNLLLEVDHIVPVSKWGQSTPENLQTLCWKCNRSKGNR